MAPHQRSSHRSCSIYNTLDAIQNDDDVAMRRQLLAYWIAASLIRLAEPALAKIPYFVVLKFVALVFAYYDRSFPDLLVRFYGALVSKIGTATKPAGGAAGKSD